MFLLIGGEGEETPGWLRAGALSDYAQQFNGRQSSNGVEASRSGPLDLEFKPFIWMLMSSSS